MKPFAYNEMFKNELTHGWYIGTRELLIGFLNKNLSKKAKVLDAGCGTGGTMIFLKNAGFKNIEGVDNSRHALQLARKRGIKNLTFASVNHLPFNNDSFDAVICLDVLYHKRAVPEKALNEFNRVLKRNGILYLQVPAYEWIHSKHDKAIMTKQRFTKGEVKTLIHNSHFRITKLSYFNTILFLPQMIKRVKDKLLSSDVVSSDVVALPKILNTLFTKMLKIEEKILTHSNLPFGLSIIGIAKK